MNTNFDGPFMKLGIWEKIRRFFRGAPRESSLDALYRELKDSDAHVRANAAHRVGELGDPAAILILFDAILDTDEQVQREVKRSLERLGWSPPHSREPTAVMSPTEDAVSPPSAPQLSPEVQEWVPSLRDPNPTIRRDAAHKIGEFGDPSAIDPLRQVLDDPDLSVREEATKALEFLGWTPEVRTPPDPIERSRFLVRQKRWAELEAQGQDAVLPLMEALTDPDKYIRWRAARTLGRLGGTQAIEPLLKTFRDPDTGVRKGVAYAFGKLIGESLVTPLDRILNDPEVLTRKEAAETLVSQKVTSLIIEPLLRILSSDLHHPDAQVRGSTAEILTVLSRSPQPLHMEGVPSGESPSSRTTPSPLPVPTEETGSLGEATSLEAVIDRLEDPHQEERIPEIIALGLRRDTQGLAVALPVEETRTLQDLIAALQDPDLDVQRTAQQILERFPDAETVHMLLVSLGTPDETVRNQVREVLVHLGPAAVEYLIQAFKDRNPELRGRAAEILVRIGRPSVEILTRTLRDPSDLVRWRAARTLGEIADPASIPSLIDALNGEDIFLHRDAAEALVKRGVHAVGPLVRALQEGESPMRKEAAEVLGRLGDSTPIPSLLETLTDPSGETRCAAIWALGELGDATLEGALRPYLADPDCQVRGSVETALMRIHQKSIKEPLLLVNETAERSE